MTEPNVNYDKIFSEKIPLLTKKQEVSIYRSIESYQKEIFNSVLQPDKLFELIGFFKDNFYRGITKNLEETDISNLNEYNYRFFLFIDFLIYYRNSFHKISSLPIKYKILNDFIQLPLSQKISVMISEYFNDSNLLQLKQEILNSRNYIIRANSRLVFNIGRYYMGKGLSYGELVQEGNIGLIKASERFDYTMGNKFSTFATYWIRQSILKALADQTRTIRLPIHIIDSMNALICACRGLIHENKKEPTLEEISKVMKVPVSKIKKIFKVVKDPIPLETVIMPDEAVTLKDTIEDLEMIPPNEQAICSNRSDKIKSYFRFLTPREEKVIRLRFGLGEDFSSEQSLIDHVKKLSIK